MARRQKKRFSKEEKAAYYKAMRDQWQAAKDYSETHADEIVEIIAEQGLNISPKSFALIYQQMQALGLEGWPYLDAKTYQGWKENGYQVKKEEKSALKGIRWIEAGPKKNQEPEDDDDGGYMFPRVYC